MKKIILPLSFALAQMLAVSAFAQSANGTADTTATKMPPPATATEKAAGKAERKTEGKAATADRKPQEAGDVANTPHKKATKAQRTAARAKRKAAATAAVKKGEISHGEAGSTAPAAT